MNSCFLREVDCVINGLKGAVAALLVVELLGGAVVLVVVVVVVVAVVGNREEEKKDVIVGLLELDDLVVELVEFFSSDAFLSVVVSTSLFCAFLELSPSFLLTLPSFY